MGQQFGSLINELDARGVIGQPLPTVGMGATFLSWSDRAPGTIVEVFTARNVVYIKVQADDYVRVDNNGISESQVYEYTPNPNAPIYTFRINQKGFWEACRLNENNRYVKSNGGLKIGQRERYYDFTF